MEIIVHENTSWTRRWNTHRLHMMAVDPQTIFAYWEVDTTHQMIISEHFQVAWGELPLFLQLNDVTGTEFDGTNALTIQRIPVDAAADHWYFRHVKPHRQYVVDLGTITFAGHFFTILRSNAVMTPGPPSAHPLFTQPLQTTSSGEKTHPYPDAKNAQSPLSKFPYHQEFDGYSIKKGGVQK